MTKDEHDPVDSVLEAALARYSGAEPLAGLEQRVLNWVRAEGVRRHRVRRWLSPVGVVAVSGAFAVVLWMRPVPDPAGVTIPLQTPIPQLTVAPAVRKLQSRREFPTPAPATPEERALLALATRPPDDARKAFSDLHRRAEEPIQFEEIKIEPLGSDGSR